MHAEVVRPAWRYKAFYRPFLRRMLKRAERIVVASPQVKELAAELQPFRDKCVVIPYALDPRQHDPTPEIAARAAQRRAENREPLVLFVGRLVPYKGVDVLLRALADVLFGIAWNIFGDSLGDALSPTAQGVYAGTSFWSRFKRRAASSETIEPEPPLMAIQSKPVPAWQEALQANPAEKPFPTPVVDPILVAARADVRQGDLIRALNAYAHLIRHGRLVSQLLPDLAQLVKQYPRNPQVWQTLGDALASTGDMEHASQSYAQARKYSQ